MQGGGFNVSAPTQIVLSLIIANVAAYVVQLILLRSQGSMVVTLFELTPREVYTQGYIWQVFTYGWLHSPSDPGHLLWNMLLMWMFGPYLESWWGQRRFIRAYIIFLVSGGLLTVLLGALSEATGIAPSFAYSTHLGASGGVMGLMTAWGLIHAHQSVHLLFLGSIKGSHFVWLLIGFQLLVALSFSNVSWSAHFGGIFGAFILCRGLWRPSVWKQLFRRLQLQRNQAAIKRELHQLKQQSPSQKGKQSPKGWQVIDGGKAPPTDPKKWN